MIVLNLVSTLSLMAAFSPLRVLSLDTGYPYKNGEQPTIAELYRDLKCGYLMAGVTHMGLVKHILEENTIKITTAVGLMSIYNIRAVICTLFGVDVVEIGSLWLLLLYASTMQSNYEHGVANEEDEARWETAVDGLIAAHDYVMAGMQRELSAIRCRPGNRFGWYDERYERRMAAIPSDQNKLYHIQRMAYSNSNGLDRLLKTNDAQSTYGTRYESLRSRNLFLTNLGVNNPLKFTLMTAYDVQVSWGRASEVLQNDYENALMMKSRTVNFLPLLSIKMYYNVVFALLKGIMCRLLWKCLLHANTCQRRKDHFPKCRYFLVEFQHLLRLHDDPDVVGLLDHLSRSGVVVDDVIKLIRYQLYNINVILHCVTTNEPTLKSEQLPSSTNQVMSSLPNDIVGTAKAFIEDLSFAFGMVDFDVIRSLKTYVNKNCLLTSDTI